MNKLMNVLFGAEMHAGAKNIRGKKSSGCEDLSGAYNNWRATEQNSGNNYGFD